jgi:hypothetical protein
VTWRIACETALNDWREPDADTRLGMLTWLLSLEDGGPPEPEGRHPRLGYQWTTAPTGHRVEFFVDGSQSLIAIVRIR